MRNSKRPASYVPRADELEKLSGASSLALGELAGAAIGPAETSAELAQARPEAVEVAGHGRVQEGNPDRVEPGAAPGLPGTVTIPDPSSGMDTPRFSTSPPSSRDFATLELPKVSPIRPLTMPPPVPSRAPITLTAPPTPSLPMSLGNAVGAGGVDSSSPAVGGPTSGPSAPGMATGSPTYLANGSGGIAPGNGFVSTGSAYRSISSPNPGDSGYHVDFSSGGGTSGLTGTDSSSSSPYTGSTTSSPFTGPSTSAAPTSSSQGSFSIAESGPNPSGGGTIPEAPVKGHIFVSGGGSYYIGQHADFSLGGDDDGDGDVTYTGTVWNETGSAVLYSGQTPNPLSAGTPFTNTPYNPMAAEGSRTASFYFGEKPGNETIQVTTNVWVGDKKASGVTAKMTVQVLDPSWKGLIQDHDKGEVIQGKLAYGVATRDENGGISVTPGIDWSKITPRKGPATGTFNTIQLINPGSKAFATGINVPGAPTGNATGFMHADTTKNPVQYTPAPFPLVDVMFDGSPFTSIKDDTPQFPAFNPGSSTYNATFTVYFFYNPDPSPGQGIWVPEALFAWKFNATATPGAGQWKIDPNEAGITTGLLTFHSDMPKWADAAYKYLGIKLY